MSAAEIDRYLQTVPARQRAALERLRATILAIVPDAEECIAERVPAFRIAGGVVAGFASMKNHMSYLPFSDSVLSDVARELDGYSVSRSVLRFTLESPLGDELVEHLIAARTSEIRSRRR